MSKKHPAVKEKGAGIDMSDLDNDPVVSFQKKYVLYSNLGSDIDADAECVF